MGTRRRAAAGAGGWRERWSWLACAAAVSGLTVYRTWERRSLVHPDWSIARSAGRDLLAGDGLQVYARYPRAQMGPLALVLTQLPRVGYMVVAAAAGVALYLLAAAAGLPRDPSPPSSSCAACPTCNSMVTLHRWMPWRGRSRTRCGGRSW